jgi:hypothetical protein
MSESTATRLTFAIFGIVIVVAYLGLTALNATPGTLTTVFLGIAGLGSYAISRVVMHYAPPDEQGR